MSSTSNTCAELTLRLLRCGQEALNPLSSKIDWMFLPAGDDVSWSEAREILVAAKKPLVVAPLLEPGSLAMWSASALPPEQHAVLKRDFANQRQYFGERLSQLQLDDADHIETPDGQFTCTVAEFRRWVKDYAVHVGISLIASPAPRTARILVRPPGGGRPLGWIDPLRGA